MTAAPSRPGATGHDRPLSGTPWDWSDVLLFLLLFFGGLAVAGTILLSSPVEAFGRSLVRGLSSQSQTAAGNLLLQTVTYLVGVAAVFVLVLGRRHSTLGALGWRLPRLRWFAVALVAAALSVVLLGALFDALQWLTHIQNAQVGAIRQEYGHDLVLAIVAVSVVAPVAEETFFRGFVYGWMRRRLGVPVAAVLSGCVFAAAHLSYGGPSELLLFLPLALLGVVLALLYEYSGSLLPGMAVHACFNLVNVISIV
ncbi:MAG: CPBP family intramembrane glutamic endopeptidase [Candidatus Dormibacteria bacterium]